MVGEEGTVTFSWAIRKGLWEEMALGRVSKDGTSLPAARVLRKGFSSKECRRVEPEPW